MEEKDKKRFLLILMTLGEAFKEEISKERAKIYFEFLADLPILQIEQAVKTAIRECHFFPRVAQLREFALNTTRTTPEEAYLKYLERNTKETLKTLDYRPSKEEAKRALDKIRALLDSMPTPESKPISPTLTDPDKAKRFEERRQALLKQRKGKP